MAASNRRIKEYNTIHHLTSRIAHKVFFLEEEERNDFLGMVKRVATFSGTPLIGWCIMMNHFHLDVYLPEPPEVIGEEEVLCRYAALKGLAARQNLEMEFARWRLEGDAGERRVEARLDGLRRQMYDIGVFMKRIKQWFTEDYNERQSHTGTMWEGKYRDKVVVFRSEAARSQLAYIHLNPIRAAITPDFDGYAWSSYAAFVKGDSCAVRGMRILYGEEFTNEEIRTIHERLMCEKLESWKLQTAREIAEKRLAGFPVRAHALTSEAMIAQQMASIKRVQTAFVEQKVNRDLATKAKERRDLLLKEIELIHSTDPDIGIEALCERIGKPRSTVYRYLAKLRKTEWK